MANSELSSWWKSRSRCISIAGITIIGIFVLVTLSSRTHIYQKSVSASNEHGNSRLFDVIGLHRLAGFPWYSSYGGYNDGRFPEELSDVKYRGTKKLPHALVIGAKKAGTRALLEFIRVHPNVRAAGHEVHYFDKNFSKGVDWYREMMPTSIDNQITIEKTPSYLVDQEAPKRVFEMNSNMKIIIVLKDPVDRAISDFTQSYEKHKRSRRHSFEKSVFLDIENFLVNDSKPSIGIGVYSKHLRPWLQYFPLDRFCFINGENLAMNPASELKKLQDFLKIKQVITEEHFYFNSTKGFPCLKKREASGVPHCLGKGKGRTHPDVSLQAKAALYDYFEPYNQELYKITGINFNWESRNPLEKLEVYN